MPFIPDEEISSTGRFVPDEATPKEKKKKSSSFMEDVISGVKALGMSAVSAGTKGALGEAALSMGTGFAGSAVGGLRGLAAGAGTPEAAEKVRQTQEAMTYLPRTPAGQVATKVAAAPMELGIKLSGKAGGAIGEAVAGEKGRVAGESIGEAALPMALAAAPLKGFAARATGAPSKAAATPVAGKTYTPLRKMSPEEQARFARQKAQGIEPTLASVTRKPEHFRFEEQVSQMPAGEALRARQLRNENAIINAVKEVDRKKTAEIGLKPETETPLETGMVVTDALKAREAAAWKNVGDLYQKARDAGETNTFVSAKPLEQWLHNNRAEALSVPALNSIANKIQQLKTDFKGRLTVDHMEELYRSASKLSKPGDPSSYYMGKVKGLINEITAGKGGDLYREARRARLNFAKEFENQKVISDLIGVKRSYSGDPKVAAESVFNKIILSKTTSLQDLQNVSRTLMSGDLKAFPKGPKAMRELQSQTINYLIEKSNIGTLDQPRLSQAAFKRELRNIGKDKLNYLLGKKSVDKLLDTLRTMEETKVAPGRIAGSETFLNFKMEAQRVAKEEAAHHLVSSFSWLRGPVKFLKARKEAKALETGVEEALYPKRASLADIKAKAREEMAIKRKYRMEEAQPLPPAIAGATAAQEERNKAGAY